MVLTTTLCKQIVQKANGQHRNLPALSVFAEVLLGLPVIDGYVVEVRGDRAGLAHTVDLEIENV